ncbi:uncharacterized protein BJ212DRAFT_1447819 [Suillus subaureus]|uniref:NAD(P)-binding protein n=1 Tax=Suillus subaureus TaxID=48587 RepID=A0A9P7JC08_9AGAM|nr:uncharacterized protein BJ212DRAFT_1447819 [Suillus subaureus]KAG1813604.1 hypothetical protein BJ212DRAFT_1447819 [Suillus subaureus]
MTASSCIALITGSAQGIGRGITLRLAWDGFDVALNDLPNKDAELELVATEIECLGRQVCIVPADVSVNKQVKEMVDATVESWDHIFSVNARGTYLCHKYAAMQMIEQGRGSQIIGFPYSSSYAASKFAIRGLTQAAAIELGQYGITVNAYAPGAIQIPICKVEPISDFPVLENVPVKHIGQPEDIASIVSYLASKEAHFITGNMFCLQVNVQVNLVCRIQPV